MSMLTNDDLKKIKGLFRPLENKVGSLDDKVGSLGNEIGSLASTVGSISKRLTSVENRVGSIENKVDKMGADVKDLKFETKAIHLIITNERREFDERLERLEEHTGIAS